MKRILLVLCVALAPLALLATAGCGEKVETFERKQTVRESEPQMVSPGTEIVE